MQKKSGKPSLGTSSKSRSFSQQPPKSPYKSIGLFTFAVALGIFALVWFARDTNPPAIPAETKAVYVGRSSCIQCHQEENHLFLQSHHHKALAKANSETVLANFDDQVLEHDGITSRFFKKDSKYFVETESAEGKIATFEVKYVLAYHPLQQYMVELVEPEKDSSSSLQGNASAVSLIAEEARGGIGQLQVLRLTWDVDKKKWYYLRPEDVPEKIDPTDPLHWTGVTQRWNTACAACHSTDLQKNFQPDSGKFATTFSEIDVSCESCHGPGSLHVKIATTRNDNNDPNHGSGLFSFKKGTALDQINTCAPCHSRRRQLAEDFHKTRELHDVMIHEPIRQQTYYADGQIKDEVYVYGSFIQSKMFANGIRCSDCHNPHSGKTHFSDNRLCTSCHQHPAGVYDSPAHHGHTGSGPGTFCVDCHMPHRTYMGIDARRDHSIRLPRPDLSVRLKTPNACTGCHLEKKNVPEKIRDQLVRYQDWLTLRESGDKAVEAELERVDLWAKELVDQWREKKGKSPYPIHFGEVIDKVWKLDRLKEAASAIEKAESDLISVATGNSDSPIYRMTAVAEFAQFQSKESLEAAKKLLSDDDPAVVFHAIGRLENGIQREMEYMSYGRPSFVSTGFIKKLANDLVPLLSHKTRLVRTRVASVFANLDPTFQAEVLVGKVASQYNKAVDELEEVYLLNEQLGALGDLYQSIGRIEKAKKMYRAQAKARPNSFGARTSLAVLLEQEAALVMQRWQQQRANFPSDKQEEMLQQAVEKREKLAKQAKKLRDEDFLLLEADFRRGGHLPSSGILHYRYAMAHYLKGHVDLAGKHLKIACEKNPNIANNWLALATFYKAQKDWQKVISCCENLVRLDKEHPGYKALLSEAKEMMQPKKTHQ